MLTDKCKHSFSDWFVERFGIEPDADIWPSPSFYELTFSMQYGIYVDFFDSVYIDVFIEYLETTNQFIGKVKNIKSKIRIDIINNIKTRKEAREQSILKANEIYNSK